MSKSGFNKEQSLVPSTLLLLGDKFNSAWQCKQLPRKKGQRIGVTYYEVVNIHHPDQWIWRGAEHDVGKTIAARLAGWQAAEDFPPLRGGGFGGKTQ